MAGLTKAQMEKILFNGSMQEKGMLLDRKPKMVELLDEEEQVYFLRKDTEKFFPYVDEEIRFNLLKEYPEIFARFASQKDIDVAVEADWICPGYGDESMDVSLTESMLDNAIKTCAKESNIDIMEIHKEEERER